MSWESQAIALLSASLTRPLIVAVVAFLSLRAFRVQHPALKHAVWVAVLIAMLLLPLINVYAPWTISIPEGWIEPEPVEPAVSPLPVSEFEAGVIAPGPAPILSANTVLAAAMPVAEPPIWQSVTQEQLLLLLYGIGLFFIVAQRICGWILLRRLVSRSVRLGRVLRESVDVVVPLTVGVLRPVVILPAGWREWSVAKRSSVLAHEFAHIRRRDALTLSFGRLVKSLLWFHPLAWWVYRNVAELAETSCDAAALRNGRDPVQYSRILLEFAGTVNDAGHRVAMPGLAMVKPSGLSRRIDQVFSLSAGNLNSMPRRPAILMLLGVPLVFLAGSLVFTGKATAVVVEPSRAPVAAPVEVAGLLEPVQIPIQSEFGAIQGLVVRPGGTDPISNVQISLAPGRVAEAVRMLPGLLNTMAVRGRPVIPGPDGLFSDPDVINYLVELAASRGTMVSAADIRAALNGLNGQHQFTAQSDRDGRFSFANIPPGQYTVTARREGYFGPLINGGNPLISTSEVAIVANQEARVTIPMIAGAVISGRVRNLSGDSQTNTNVQALTVAYQNGFSILTEFVSKVTDDRGEYRLFWLPPGDYYIGVTPALSTTPAAERLVGGLGIKTFYPNVTNLTEAVPITIRGGEELSGIGIDLRTTRTVKISGRVTSAVQMRNADGTPAPANGAALLMLKRDVTIPEDIGARTVGTVAFDQSNTGVFEIANVLPGSYDLYARIGDPQSTPPFHWGRVPIDVAGTDIRGVNITVRQSMSMRGSISGTGRLPTGTNVQVALRPDGSSGRLPAYQAVRMANIAADGTFTLSGIPEGSFHAEIWPRLPGDLYVADVRQGASVFDSGFSIASDQPNPIQIVVNAGAGRLNGTVLDARKEPVARATVVLIPPEPRRQNPALYHTTTSDASGRFALQGIAPGSYKLFAWETVPTGAYRNTGFIATFEERGVPVNVSQSTTANADVAVIPADGQ